MLLQNKSVLITGGGSGIGLAIAKAFAEKGARITLAGRNEERLQQAVAELPGANYIVADVTSAEDTTRLIQQVKKIYGGLDILVNNAGVSAGQNPASDTIYEQSKYEMEINFFAVLRLTQQFLPILKESGDAAIINIQSVLSYVPAVGSATYSASKAALHSYSQSLRLHLELQGDAIKVFEVFPPLTDTGMAKRFTADKLTPEEVAADIVAGVEANNYAIRNGKTKDVYQLVRKSPEEALAALNSLMGVKAVAPAVQKS